MSVRARVLSIILMSAVGVAIATASGAAVKRHDAIGMVLRVDKEHRSIEVSCNEIPDYMAAMEMSFKVRDARQISDLNPGARIGFAIVEEGKSLFAEDIHAETAAVFEPEPMAAGGLTALHKTLNPAAATKAVKEGQPIPDFTLTDQVGNEVRLSQFQGKVVAITFGYSRCPNPNYCYRLSNNLAQVRKQLHTRAEHDLVLLTIAIDPAHDHGEVLQEYAASFHADPRSWHFLTGPVSEIQEVAGMFGMNFWADEGLLTHSLHTVIVDRNGKLAVNLEGNQFSVQQLVDLVKTVMDRPS